MTLEDLIAEVSRRKLRLNNLFQLDDGRWQANITDGQRFWEFGRGDNAMEALIRAINLTATTTPEYGIERAIRTEQQYSYRAPKPVTVRAAVGVLPDEEL